MLEEAVFVIFTLITLGIVFVKLLNVFQLGTFYDPEWSIATFVVLLFSFMFVMFMVMNNAGEDPVLISYLWGHIAMFTTAVILFLCEALMWFYLLLPKKSGSEKYGQRGKLIIKR
jgi:hypothetical protein